MGFKLGKSTEDKMKEAMVFGTLPEGVVVKTTFEKLIAGMSEDFSMIQYRMNIYTTPPMEELTLLKIGLSKLGIGLALYEDANFFFISRSKIMPIKDQLQSAFHNLDDQSSIAWVVLVKFAWQNGITLAGVKYFREGFEVKIFIKDQKPKQTFIKTI